MQHLSKEASLLGWNPGKSDGFGGLAGLLDLQISEEQPRVAVEKS